MKRYGYRTKRGIRCADLVLTDEMIELRNNLARGLGYVLRPCSMGATEKDGVTPRQCWEREAIDWEYKGRMMSSFHLVPTSNLDVNGRVFWSWPEEAEEAAYALEKAGLAPKAGKKPGADQGGLFGGKQEPTP